MDLSQRRAEIIQRATERYEGNVGTNASPLLIATAVDISLQKYATTEGRENLLARIGETKAHLKEAMIEQDPGSQETFDVVDAVRDTFEVILSEMN